MKKIYYLIYQLKNINVNWIVSIDRILSDKLLDAVYYESDKEIYKIYSRLIPDNKLNSELKYKQFDIFNINKTDILVKKSLLY